MSLHPFAPDEWGTILAVFAHPDDETYTAGAMMAAAVAAGGHVVCVSATVGEHGTDDPDEWPPDRLGRTRRWETAAAMAVLGVRDHRFLGYADGGCADVPGEQGRSEVAALLDEVRPDTVVTFGPDGITGHDDHIAVSRWTTAAWDGAGRPGRLLWAALGETHLRQWGAMYESAGVYMTDDRPVPVPDDELALCLQVDGELLDQKMAALRAMSTQTSGLFAELGDHVAAALVADEMFVDAATVLDT